MERDHQEPSHLGYMAIIFSAFCLFFFFSLYGINQLGLTTDECVFVNAAIANGKSEYIYMKIFNIPFMTFMYEGALKAWIFTPIFKLFPVNVYSIRIPAILMAAVTLLIWLRSSRYLFKEKLLSLVFLCLLATDPAYIHHTNIEFNTVVLHSMIIALMFLFYLRWTQTNTIANFGLFLLCIILGIYNRFNFIWIAFGLSVTSFLFNFDAIKATYQPNKKKFLIAIGIFCVVIALMLNFLIIPASHYPVGGSILNTLSFYRLISIHTLYQETMAGNFPYMMLFNQSIPYVGYKNLIILAITIIAFLTGVIAWLFGYRNEMFCSLRRLQLVFLSILSIGFALIVITPQARMSYHIMTLWPLPYLIFVISIAMLGCLIRRYLRTIFIITLATSVISFQLFANYYYAASLTDENKNVNPLWTTAIYQLQDYVEMHARDYDEIMSLNFGFLFQLIGLTPNDATRAKLHEEVWIIMLKDPTWIGIRNMFFPQYTRDERNNRDWLYYTYFKNKKVLLIRAPSMNTITEAVHFSDFADEYHIKVNLLTTIPDKHGYPIYFLYSAEG